MDPALARTIMTIAWAIMIAYWYFASKGVSEPVEEEGKIGNVVHHTLFVSAFAIVLLPIFDIGVGTPPLPATGLVLQLAGVAFAIWARYTLGEHWSSTISVKEGHELVTRGPYAIVRHPIYTGLLLGLLGSAILLGDLRGWIGFVLAIGAVSLKVPREERFMEATFGERWAAYRSRVKAIVPYLF